MKQFAYDCPPLRTSPTTRRRRRPKYVSAMDRGYIYKYSFPLPPGSRKKQKLQTVQHEECSSKLPDWDDLSDFEDRTYLPDLPKSRRIVEETSPVIKLGVHSFEPQMRNAPVSARIDQIFGIRETLNEDRAIQQEDLNIRPHLHPSAPPPQHESPAILRERKVETNSKSQPAVVMSGKAVPEAIREVTAKPRLPPQATNVSTQTMTSAMPASGTAEFWKAKHEEVVSRRDTQQAVDTSARSQGMAACKSDDEILAFLRGESVAALDNNPIDCSAVLKLTSPPSLDSPLRADLTNLWRMVEALTTELTRRERIRKQRFEETLIRLRDLNSRSRRDIKRSVESTVDKEKQALLLDCKKREETLQQTVQSLRKMVSEREAESQKLSEKCELLSSEVKLSKSMQQMQVEAAIRSAAERQRSGLQEALQLEKQEIKASYEQQANRLQEKCKLLEQQLQQMSLSKKKVEDELNASRTEEVSKLRKAHQKQVESIEDKMKQLVKEHKTHVHALQLEHEQTVSALQKEWHMQINQARAKPKPASRLRPTKPKSKLKPKAKARLPPCTREKLETSGQSQDGPDPPLSPPPPPPQETFSTRFATLLDNYLSTVNVD